MENNNGPKPPLGEIDLKEGVDYYLDEDELLVFTASYLLKRGFCCHQGCRHCPYPIESE